ncbi:MAG: hypothetical protein ACYC0V_00875 [Armatimonadota bacterium]
MSQCLYAPIAEESVQEMLAFLNERFKGFISITGADRSDDFIIYMSDMQVADNLIDLWDRIHLLLVHSCLQ